MREAEPIIAPFAGGEAVQVRTLPAEENMACIVHKGPFSTMWEATEALFAWIRQNGYELNGPVREIYHKGEWVTNDQNEYITELQAPVRQPA